MSEDTLPRPSDDAVGERLPMATVGEQLSRARAARGLSVEDVAAQLKFAPRQVLALEQGRPEGVPGGAFVRGMIRSYCRLLKMDPEPLLAAMPVVLPDSDRLTERFSQPVPFSDSARRWNFAYAGLAILALAVAGWFAWEWQSPEETPAAKSASVESPAALPTALPSESPAPAPAQPAAVPTSQAASSSLPPQPVAASSVPQPALATVPAVPSAAAQLPDRPPPGMRRLVLRFQREAWVEVRDRAGRMVFSQLNPAGSEKVVDSPVPMSLIIGNAQYVRLSMDGSPVDLQPYIKVEVARLTLP